MRPLIREVAHARGVDDGNAGCARDRSVNFAPPPCESAVMRLLRSLRRPVIRAMIGILLFAQMAIAAYACPNLSNAMSGGASMPSQAQAATSSDAVHSEKASPTMGAANAAQNMPADCGQVDLEAPNLCAEHCKQGQQSADHTPSPTVAPALLTALYSVTLSTATPTSEAAYYAPGLLLQAAAPPHAIEHCCLRT